MLFSCAAIIFAFCVQRSRSVSVEIVGHASTNLRLCRDVGDVVDTEIDYTNKWMKREKQDSLNIDGFREKQPISGFLYATIEARYGFLRNLNTLERLGETCVESLSDGKYLRGGLHYENLQLAYDEVNVDFLWSKLSAQFSCDVRLELNFTIKKSTTGCILTKFDPIDFEMTNCRLGIESWLGWLLQKLLHPSLLRNDQTSDIKSVVDLLRESVSSYFSYYWCWNWGSLTSK